MWYSKIKFNFKMTHWLLQILDSPFKVFLVRFFYIQTITLMLKIWLTNIRWLRSKRYSNYKIINYFIITRTHIWIPRCSFQQLLITGYMIYKFIFTLIWTITIDVTIDGNVHANLHFNISVIMPVFIMQAILCYIAN